MEQSEIALPLKHFSSGGVIIGPDGKIAITNQNGDSWSLPKGHVEKGESTLDAARREIYEETGIRTLTLIEKLGEYTRPTIGSGGKGSVPGSRKQITLYFFATDQIDLKPIDPHNPEARWVGIDEVEEYLTHQMDVAFYRSIKGRIVNYLQKKA